MLAPTKERIGKDGAEKRPGVEVLAPFGDQWLLLVLAEAARGAARFGEFENRLDIPPPTLAKCLKWLVEREFLSFRIYRERPLHRDYVLTESAQAIGPLLVTLSAWADQHIVNALPRGVDPGLSC